MEKKIIDTFGYILKENHFEQLSSSYIPKTIVIRDLNPFPGYYGKNLPLSDCSPGHIYFITKKNYNWEDITVISDKIKKYIHFPFVYNNAIIKGEAKTLNAIRIKNLETCEQVEKIQKAYEAEGIKFKRGNTFPLIGLTKIKKFFILNQWSENIYHDEEDANLYYITIPNKISWELFKHITLQTKSNLNAINFDAAQAIMYYRNEMINTIRLYSENLQLEEIETIRNKYIEIIKRHS